MMIPESHSRKIERQDRRDQQKEVKSRQKELEEKFGKSTIIVEDPQGKEQEVSGADCPDCDGVIVVVSKPNKYPPYEEKCRCDE